jgi:hypothetical protein
MESNQTREVGLNDLGQLSLRANVAFAVRCAQRIRPRFNLPADAPSRREKLAAVDRAIRVAAAYCEGLPMEPGQAEAALRMAAAVANESDEITSYAGYGAVRAAEAAIHAEEFVRHPGDSRIMEVVAAAFGAGRVLAANAGAFSSDLVVAALYADLVKLMSLSQGHCQQLGPPIDPAETGPLGTLWPAGAPAWFVPAAS